MFMSFWPLLAMFAVFKQLLDDISIEGGGGYNNGYFPMPRYFEAEVCKLL